MKINVLTASTKLTGGNRVIMELINGLVKKGHEVTLVTLAAKSELNWIQLNAPVLEVRRTRFQHWVGYLYRSVFGFQPFPEEETRLFLGAMPKADINLATLSYTGFAVHRAEHGIPMQLHMHYDPYVREDGYKRKVMIEAFHLPIAKIGNSTWIQNTLKTETGGKVAGLVFPAIDHTIFNSTNHKTHIDTTKKIRIVSLAKYKWWKGFPDALRAIQLVRDSGYDVEFHAFGGAFDPKTLPLDTQHIPFTFVGSKANEELAQFYRDADLLISSSFFESFPLPQLEAMACGTPVVTTRYGTEDYAHHEENALVIEPKHPELMAQAIIRMLTDQALYEKCSRNGRDTAQKFTWENAVESLERICVEAISRSVDTRVSSE